MNGDASTALTTIDGAVLTAEPVRQQMIRPLATPDEALEAWKAFQALKAKLVTADDIQPIQGKNAVKKSGWRKIGAAFGLDYELVSEERNDRQIPGLGSYGFTWETTVRAIAPNGRHADGVGSCDSSESRFKKNSDHLEHDVRSTAYTRACNRAISDLVGGGEVSAEELKADPKPTPISRTQAESVVDGFYDACQREEMPQLTPRDLMVLLVMERGNIRQVYRNLKAQHVGEAASEAGAEDPDEG